MTKVNYMREELVKGFSLDLNNLKFFNVYLLLWPCWFFAAVGQLSLVAASRGCSSSQCEGFSLR